MIIGLLEKGLPKFGVIYRPVGDVLYAGVCDEVTWIVTGEAADGPGFLQLHRLIPCAWLYPDPIVTR